MANSFETDHGKGGEWRSVMLPLTGFWLFLLAGAGILSVAGPGWLETMARNDAQPERRARQEMMREARRILGAGESEGTAPLGDAVAAERAGKADEARKALSKWPGFGA